jgi:hypothetical protein
MYAGTTQGKVPGLPEQRHHTKDANSHNSTYIMGGRGHRCMSPLSDLIGWSKWNWWGRQRPPQVTHLVLLLLLLAPLTLLPQLLLLP